MPEARAEGMRLRGLLGQPGVGRATRQEMVTVINGRPVDSRVMAYALTESYHTFIPKGRFPLAFLFLDMDPSLVDVNVHPAKREVRFRDEPAVRRLIIEAVLSALQPGTPVEVSGPPPVSESDDDVPAPKASTQAEAPAAPNRFSSENSAPGCVATGPATAVVAAACVRPSPAPVLASTVMPAWRAPVSPPPVPTSARADAPVKLDWRLAGRLPDSLVLFETSAGLVVLNLRAAHERIVYERVLRRFESRETASQQLLLPPALEFEPLAGAALRERLKLFESAGFGLEEFGRNFFRLTAVPDWLNEAEAERFVRDLVAALARRDGEWRTDTLAHEALARLAGGRAVRADDRLGDAEVMALVRDLFACRQPAVCLRGRKVFFELSNAEIARRFGV